MAETTKTPTTNKTIQVINYIRQNASEGYKQRVPILNDKGQFVQFANPLKEYCFTACPLFASWTILFIRLFRSSSNLILFIILEFLDFSNIKSRCHLYLQP